MSTVGMELFDRFFLGGRGPDETVAPGDVPRKRVSCEKKTRVLSVVTLEDKLRSFVAHLRFSTGYSRIHRRGPNGTGSWAVRKSSINLGSIQQMSSRQ